MNVFNFNETELVKLITHRVGNKLREEELVLTTSETLFEIETGEYLMNYFLQDFKIPEFFSFTHKEDLEMNKMFILAKQIFESKDNFKDASHEIAQHLYNCSIHPKVKDGDLNIAYFDNLVLEDEVVDGIGIFKTERYVPFLKMNGNNVQYTVEHEFGIEIKKVDKACIIFNTDEDYGYAVLIVDNQSKTDDALYWKEDFLNLEPMNDEYHNTREYLTLTKDFVTNQLPEESELESTDRIQLLNRSLDYFKTNDSFDKSHFEDEVFQDESLIDSFRKYDDMMKSRRGFDLDDNFNISNHAVKKHQRVFRSVLKLDKNFHVYIHGDKNLIHRGKDSDGRKFYKIYYENES